LSDAAKDITYLQQLLDELCESTENATIISSDNQSSIKLMSNPIFHSHTKYISIQDHFIREKAKAKEIALQYIPTIDQEVDFLTKLAQYPSFVHNKEKIGVKILPCTL